MVFALFAWLISRTFSDNEQYFSLTTNQPTVPSAMAYQPSEQGSCRLKNISFLLKCKAELLPFFFQKKSAENTRDHKLMVMQNKSYRCTWHWFYIFYENKQWHCHFLEENWMKDYLCLKVCHIVLVLKVVRSTTNKFSFAALLYMLNRKYIIFSYANIKGL